MNDKSNSNRLYFRCPVCGTALTQIDGGYVCKNNHHYNLAKENYINLLLSQKAKTKRRGDDKRMLQARRAFLEKGFYRILLQGLYWQMEAHIRMLPPARAVNVLDIGCGECWYTRNLQESCAALGMDITFLGVDIAKDALRYGAKRANDLHLAVASAYKIPLSDASCDCIFSVFAPFSHTEVLRLLRPDGIFLRAVPNERHLWELKAAVYDQPHLHTRDSDELDGFLLVHKERLQTNLALDNSTDIQNLFLMTPYYYKTSRDGQQRLEQLQRLTVSVDIELLLYKINA